MQHLMDVLHLELLGLSLIGGLISACVCTVLLSANCARPRLTGSRAGAVAFQKVSMGEAYGDMHEYGDEDGRAHELGGRRPTQDGNCCPCSRTCFVLTSGLMTGLAVLMLVHYPEPGDSPGGLESTLLFKLLAQSRSSLFHLLQGT